MSRGVSMTGAPRAVVLTAPDPSWADRFAAERSRIAAIFSEAVRIEHIGSTAVPGLLAKPVVDILLVLPETPPMPERVRAMEAIGYEHLGEYGIVGRTYFRRQRAFHVHAFPVGHIEVERDLLFRDHLRADPDRARAYAELKLHLAAIAKDQVEYSRLKRPFVDETIEQARAAGRDISQS